jgi:hypothetical protein
MKRVLKTEVPIDDQWHTVTTGPIQHVGQQYDDTTVCAWWEDQGMRPRRLRVFGTGHQIHDDAIWIGTVQAADGLVWHLFEAMTTTAPLDEDDARWIARPTTPAKEI